MSGEGGTPIASVCAVPTALPANGLRLPRAGPIWLPCSRSLPPNHPRNANCSRQEVHLRRRRRHCKCIRLVFSRPPAFIRRLSDATFASNFHLRRMATSCLARSLVGRLASSGPDQSMSFTMASHRSLPHPCPFGIVASACKRPPHPPSRIGRASGPPGLASCRAAVALAAHEPTRRRRRKARGQCGSPVSV